MPVLSVNSDIACSFSSWNGRTDDKRVSGSKEVGEAVVTAAGIDTEEPEGFDKRVSVRVLCRLGTVSRLPVNHEAKDGGGVELFWSGCLSSIMRSGERG